MNTFSKISFLIFLLALVNFSCNNKQEQKDKDIDELADLNSDNKLKEGNANSKESATRIEDWIGMDELTGNSKPISYTQDKSFLGSGHQDVIYLGALSNNDICTLQKNGAIKIINSSGTELKSWLPHIEGNIAALAIDESDEIYVLSSLKKKIRKKIRGKLIDYELPVGIGYHVFNMNGELVRKMQIDALKQVMGAKLYKDKLVISDSKDKAVGIFNKSSGELLAKMEGMRPCGDVLDISISAKGEILIGNLGSFRIEIFNMNGKRLGAYGERGKELKDFHGCCNPVNLASLKSGAIVTVEKFPTRIKLFCENEVLELPESEELKSCKYMPFISDSDNNLYVGAGGKGLVKYVPSH